LDFASSGSSGLSPYGLRWPRRRCGRPTGGVGAQRSMAADQQVWWGAWRAVAHARSSTGAAAARGLGGGWTGAWGVRADRRLGEGKEWGRDAPGPRTWGLENRREMAWLLSRANLGWGVWPIRLKHSWIKKIEYAIYKGFFSHT
jgi:hypothetical protein